MSVKNEQIKTLVTALEEANHALYRVWIRNEDFAEDALEAMPRIAFDGMVEAEKVLKVFRPAKEPPRSVQADAYFPLPPMFSCLGLILALLCGGCTQTHAEEPKLATAPYFRQAKAKSLSDVCFTLREPKDLSGQYCVIYISKAVEAWR